MSQGYTSGIPIDTDGTLSANSDFLVPSQKAVKTYVDTEIAAIPTPTTPDLDAVLTAGNDGGGLEIANIADGTAVTSAATFGQIMFTMYYGHQVFNYADSTTYLISGNQYTPAGASTDPWGYFVPFNCKITAASILLFCIATIGTNEDISVYVRVNDTTDYLIDTIGLAQRDRLFSSTSLNGGSGISLTAGDYVAIKIVTPAWATNPTQNLLSGNLFLVRQ